MRLSHPPPDHLENPRATVDNVGNPKWMRPGWGGRNSGSNLIALNRIYYCISYLDREFNFVRIGLNVATAGAALSVARLGIYSAVRDGDGDLTPGALLLDAGTVAVDSTGDKEIVIDQTIPQGYFFLTYSSDGAPTLQAHGDASGWYSPITSFHNSQTGENQLILRVTVADGAVALTDPATAPTNLEPAAFAAPLLRRAG